MDPATQSQMDELLRLSSSCKDRSRALADLAELLGSQRPSCEAMVEHKIGGYDIAAVITTMRGVFDEVNEDLRHERTKDPPGIHDYASRNTIIESALAVVAALPSFSEVVTPFVLLDIVGRAQTERGHATSRGGDFLGQFDGLLDNVMHLIVQVTEAVCTTLSSCTDAGASADVAMPLYRLITGWECAFRGKADCLRIANQLFKALLGHNRCCEDPSSSVDDADEQGRKNGIDTAPPLWLSDRGQQTLDVYHCIVATFEATQGPDFKEWVMATPYWVTLLNIAAGHACAFTAEDVVSGRMPARHNIGLLMLERLANSPFADLAVTTASTLLLSAQVWETADSKRSELASERDLDSVPQSLFFVDTESYAVKPNESWSGVCPSAECGAMTLTGWLASARPSSLQVPAGVIVNCPDFARFMKFFAVTSVSDQSALLDRMSTQRPDFDFAAHVSCSVLPPESVALRLTALWAAAHFAGKEENIVDSSEVNLFLILVGGKDLAAAVREPAAIVIAEIGVCLATWDDGRYPTGMVGFDSWNVTAEFGARILKTIMPIIFERHAIDPVVSNAYWRLCSVVLGHANVNGSHLDASDLLNIAQHALAELERGCPSLYDAPTIAKVDCVRAPQPSLGLLPPTKYSMPGGRRHKRVFHKHFREPTRASILSSCVVKCIFRLTWTHGSFPADEARRIVQWLRKDLERVHAVVAPIGEALARCEVLEVDVQHQLTYVRTIESTRNMMRALFAKAGDDLFVTMFDTVVELSNLPQHPGIVGPLIPLLDKIVSVIAIEDLDRSRRAAAFDLSCRDEVLKHRGGALFATLVRRVCIGAGHFVPPLGSFLETLGDMLESGHSVSDLRQAAHVVSEAAHPGAASLAAVERVWTGIAAHVPDDGDEWCWGFFAGQLLRAVSRHQLLSASRTFMKLFLSVPLAFPEAESHGDALKGIAPVCAFVQYADPSAIKERSRDITYALRHTLRVHYGGSLRLAQCVIDNAIEGRGMTVDLGIIDDVMWGCRRALNLPRHVHPCVRWRPPVECCRDPQNGSAGSDAYSNEEEEEKEKEEEEEESNEEESDDDWTPVVAQPVFGVELPRCFDARRAIAALLAVAEWLHRNCATTVVVSTVQQGPVLERTVTASSDALRQLDSDAAAAAPTAAAMVVSSVAHWLPKMEYSFQSLDAPVGSPSTLQEAQQMWDRIVRWAMDPSLNAALLTTLPIPRDEILQIAVRADLSPWAEAAVQEVLSSDPPPMHRPLTNRGKRLRPSRR